MNNPNILSMQLLLFFTLLQFLQQLNFTI